MDPKELVELIKGATDEDKAAFASALGVGATTATEAAAPAATEPATPAPAEAAEAIHARGSVVGRMIVSEAVRQAGLDERLVESVLLELPDRFAEADVARQVEAYKRIAEGLEKAGLAPKVPHVAVTGEDRAKKAAALDAMLAGNYKEGYRSIKAAYRDIAGVDHRALDEAELAFAVLRESYVGGRREGERSTESVDSATWGELLGDSITRRMVAEYALPQLTSWRSVVSSIVPRNDFRTVRVGRMGGYGTLPAVGQGAPYQALTSPTDEEATYAITKRGGTEDLTIEAIANDDLGAVQRIPRKLGRAAAQTLYRFVWDLLATNATCTYDSVALFAAGHANTDTGAALAQATLSTGRRKMRKQAAYGDSVDVLGIVPKTLVVPSDLEEIAFQLSTSAVAIPSSGNSSDIPNLHQALEVIVLDYLSDTNDWFLVADTGTCPTIELGFFGGREDPELFVQDDPRVGSAFTSDKVTYKIRHIYSGTVLDHRGFYRGQG